MKTFKELLENPRAEPESIDIIKSTFEIKKSNEEQMLAFGWASVAQRNTGEVIVDYDDDIITPDMLEKTAYNFVEFYREGGEGHIRGGAAVLIESMVFTKEKLTALGLAENSLPTGWWIGFKVIDKDVWTKVKDGTYKMFSIEGSALRKEVEI